MTKYFNQRDHHIADLVQKYGMEFVNANEIPHNLQAETQQHTLLEQTGRRIVHTEHYFSFRIGDKGFTAPATSIKKLRRGDIDHRSSGYGRTRWVFPAEYPELTNYDDILDEVQPWGHQVTLELSNNPDWNVYVYVERWCEDGTWQHRTYKALMEFPRKFLKTCP